MMEKLANLILWPGTRICAALGIDPKGELGLLRSYLNMLVWLPIGLLLVWIFH